jgi:uncharacterized membrane protein YdjX (TVP38/TMEM64 family)
MKRLTLLVPIGVAIAVLVGLGLQGHLTLDAFEEGQETFDAWYAQRPVLVSVAYFGLVTIATLFLPVAAPLTVIAGALFGLWKGLLIASFATSFAATLGFLLSRFVLHDLVQRHYGEGLAAVNAGIAADGAFYLFSLRLVTVIPFFAVNLVMGLTPMRTSTFHWVTQVGLLTPLLIYVNAGIQLAEVDSIADVFSPSLIASLALLGGFPILARKVLVLLRRRVGSR